MPERSLGSIYARKVDRSNCAKSGIQYASMVTLALGTRLSLVPRHFWERDRADKVVLRQYLGTMQHCVAEYEACNKKKRKSNIIIVIKLRYHLY